jgi:hypothetical protein
MGTKSNPDQFDCYQRAEPDEPLFTMLARDPQGGDFVHLWAALRSCDMIGAERIFERMKHRARYPVGPRRAGDGDKICSAINNAEAMRAWRKANRP